MAEFNPREEREPTEEELHQTHVLLGAPDAIGLEYIRKLARFLTDKAAQCAQPRVSVEDILDAAKTYQIDTRNWGPTTVWRGNAFSGMVIEDIFWKHFENYTGIWIPDEYRENFLSYGSST